MTEFSLTDIDPGQIAAVEFVSACRDLTAALDVYTGRLGFRLDMIFPADAPRIAVVSGHGVRVRLVAGDDAGPDRVRLLVNDVPPGSGELFAPGGAHIELAPAGSPLESAPFLASLVVSDAGDATWGAGRAGMEYRDLIPGRLGGRYIASHIRIQDGGPVPDYVHHHRVGFQVIYCYKGWVKVVYEDQGPPFVMYAGDCVLQPPNIRHRVLECSDAMEVIEISCPAEHETWVDHDMELPTASLRPDRDFNGQRFVFHHNAEATWTPGPFDGFEASDTGVGEATGGFASVQVLRSLGEPLAAPVKHDADFFFHFVLQGSVTLQRPRQPQHRLGSGGSFVVPAGVEITLGDASPDLEVLQVAVNAERSAAE